MAKTMQTRQMFGRWYPMPPMWLEGRALLEWASLRRDPILAGLGVPYGEGRAVMLIPGFLAGDRSMDVMRDWLRRTGYRPLRSGINLNVVASTVLVNQVVARLRRAVATGTKAVLVGQSRGGSIAFGLAQRFPELVERVITLGTPLGDPMDLHPTTMAWVHAARLLHTLQHGPTDIDGDFNRQLLAPAAVPVTSLYSRTDGIVHWEACLRPDVETIEVGGSHVGMGVNARVYRELARLLSLDR
jgi:triacylglycerol lipase